MDTFMSETIVLEVVLASVLMALWMTWLLMRGLFKLMPTAGNAAGSRPVQPIQPVHNAKQGISRRRAA